MKLSAFFPFLILVASQLLGEWISRSLALPVPGPVVGAVILFLALCFVPGLHAQIAPFAHTLLRNMLLFYVPASVGIMAIVGDVAQHGPLLIAVTIISTWATALASALVFDTLRKRQQEPA